MKIFPEYSKAYSPTADKEKRKYIHFVDGGITDNMGLRAMTDVIAISGGPSAMFNRMQRKIPTPCRVSVSKCINQTRNRYG